MEENTGESERGWRRKRENTKEKGGWLKERAPERVRERKVVLGLREKGSKKRAAKRGSAGKGRKSERVGKSNDREDRD